MHGRAVDSSLHWLPEVRTTRDRTVNITSDLADWRQDFAAEARYPLQRRQALHLLIEPSSTDGGYVSVLLLRVECEGGFSGAASPPELSDVTFYLQEHALGDRTAADVRFELDRHEAFQFGEQHWGLQWRCRGEVSIGDDVMVQFRSRLLVDTFGMFGLVAPTVSPASGHTLDAHGRSRLQWHASLAHDATGLVPTLTIYFPRH